MSEKVLVTPTELQEMMGPDTVVIDTRSPDAYAAGHVPGAVNVHEIFTYLATSTPEGMAELRGKFADAFGQAGLSGAETAVFYEGSMNSGFGQSCRGYFLLSWLGYPKAKVLHGGFQAWTTADLLVSTDPAAPAPKMFPLSDAGSAMMIDRDAMLPPSATRPSSSSTCGTWTSGSALAPRPTARISALGRAASPARDGSSGTA